MGREDKRKLDVCSECGSIIDPKQRLEKILRDADKSLKRYTNKMRKKNDTSKQSKR